MQDICRRLHVPCVFLRMFLMTLIVAGAALYSGYTVLTTIAVVAVSLILMQLVYFAIVLLAVWSEARTRD